MGPLKPVSLQQLRSTGNEATQGPTPFLPLAEIHLQLGSVILVFSTLGISRSCAAILAFLMHWNQQTLKVRAPQASLSPQLPPAGRVRAGRKGAQALPWGLNWGVGGRRVTEGSSKSGALLSIPHPRARSQRSGPEAEASALEARGMGQAQGLRLGKAVASRTIIMLPFSLPTGICSGFSEGSTFWLPVAARDLKHLQGSKGHLL